LYAIEILARRIMRKILYFLFVAGSVAWFIYLARSTGILKTEAERTVILAAEGRVRKVNPAAGEIDIFYSDRVPDCYPIFGDTKVSHPDLLKDVKEGDSVSFELKAVRLFIRGDRGFVPLHVKEITSIQVIEDPGKTERKVFHCPR
jgi:hypothetical protein